MRFDVELVVGVALRVHAALFGPGEDLARHVWRDRRLARHVRRWRRRRSPRLDSTRSARRCRAPRERPRRREHPAGDDRDVDAASRAAAAMLSRTRGEIVEVAPISVPSRSSATSRIGRLGRSCARSVRMRAVRACAGRPSKSASAASVSRVGRHPRARCSRPATSCGSSRRCAGPTRSAPRPRSAARDCCRRYSRPPRPACRRRRRSRRRGGCAEPASTDRRPAARDARARSVRSRRGSALRRAAWIRYVRSASTRSTISLRPGLAREVARQQLRDALRASRGRATPRRRARADRARPARATRRRRTPAARARRQTTSTSEGPARPSMPQTPNTWRLASVTQTLPGPTILSTRRDRRRAVGERGDRLRAAGGVEFVDAAQAHANRIAGLIAAVALRAASRRRRVRRRRSWPARPS